MTGPEVVVHPDTDQLAHAAAARLGARLVGLQEGGGVPSVALTGGGVGTATLAALAESPAREAIDWARLDLWWGDERFLPSGDPERNETGARSVLLDRVRVDPARVHPMPASNGPAGSDPEAAASRYADELAAHPGFDVVLLGVGPDGHIASLFPERPAMYETERTVVAVHGAPKPPPIRISLTLSTINAASEVWFLVGGAEKATAVRLALSGAGHVQIPAAGARGLDRTLWLLDRAAAGDLPPDLRTLAAS